MIELYVSIRSHWNDETWSGDIPEPTEDGIDVFSYIWRYFNRVDEADEHRLESIDYRLPSLSIGDIVEVHKMRFRIATLGWDMIGEAPGPRRT